MRRQLSIVLFLAVIWSGSLSLAATERQSTEKIRGRIVAYQADLVAHACFDSICGGSFIVRLNSAKATYVHVEFAYADNTAPHDSMTVTKLWQLTVERTREFDTPLRQFFPLVVEGSEKENDTTIPMWISVAGAEKEQLPFGQVLPSFRLAKNMTTAIWRRT